METVHINGSQTARKEAKERELRERLNAAFKDKGVETLREKRLIMNEVIGHNGILDGLDFERYERLIAHVEGISENEFLAKPVGWFCVTESGQGMDKIHMRKLMNQIPSDAAVSMIHVKGEGASPMDVFGYIRYTFHEKHREAIQAALKTVAREEPATASLELYTLNGHLQVHPIQEIRYFTDTSETKANERTNA